MKVLRSTEWAPIGWMNMIPGVGCPGYVFLNKRYGDVATLKVAKYIDVSANDSFIYDAETRSVRRVCEKTGEPETSLPSYSVAMG